mmetsp:Transcript_39806/g.96078  ORF Transcript_39806/g.96078 Transcript_39806/m.96078 type:complete len:287 (+) Transcript_39806:75-935(+)
MPPPPELMIDIMGDVFWNVFTGYHEKTEPTNPERAQERFQNEVQACQDLLNSLVGPGDLLDSDVRFDFAYEAYYANDTSSKPAETTTNTRSPYKEYALKIVNEQDTLDELTYNSFIGDLSKRFPDHNTEDHTAMAIELAVIAASCAGVCAFYMGVGKERPLLPTRHSPCKEANFKSVQDYCDGPLFDDKNVSWGPALKTKQLKPDVVEKFNIDLTLWKFGGAYGPTTKATAAPLICIAWIEFMHTMYAPVTVLPRLMKSPGPDRFLFRGQLEIAAAAYSSGVRCRY